MKAECRIPYTRGFTILDLRFTNGKLAAYADGTTNECLLPMVGQVILQRDFSRITLCLYAIQDYFPIIFEAHVAEFRNEHSDKPESLSMDWRAKGERSSEPASAGDSQ